jgi:hypothetical protein
MHTMSIHAARRQSTPPTPRDIQAHAARNLRLLQAIDETLTALSTEADMLRLISRDLAEVEAGLIDAAPVCLLDPDGMIDRSLEAILSIAERLHDRGEAGHRAALADAQLHVEDGVAEAWADYITAAAELHSAAQALRERIGTLDALQSPRSGKTYGSAADLFDAMGL